MNEPLVLMGGTYDPVHFGHLRPALEVAQALGVDRLHMVPAPSPPHRDEPGAPAAHRVAMLERALAGQERLVLDTRELEREGPSYTVDTLAGIREHEPDRPVALVIGEDSFASLTQWHEWQRLPELAHLVVMTRPGAPRVLDAALERLSTRNRARDPAALRPRPAGLVLTVPVTGLDISASKIRAMIGRGGNPRWLLPDCVLDYIREYGLYGHDRRE